MNKKRYVFLLVLSIGMVLSIILLSSYALWRVRDGQTGQNDIYGACLSINFESDTNGLTSPNAWPMSIGEALAEEGYTFTVKNNCDIDVPYEVVLDILTPEGTKMPDQYVRVRLDDEKVQKVSEMDPREREVEGEYPENLEKIVKIYTGTIPGNDEVSHTLRQWYSEDAPPSTVGAKYSTKVEIIAGQGIVPIDQGEICYLVEPITGTLLLYNPECGTDVTLPAEYMGIPIKTISSKAFHTENTYVLYDEYTEEDVDFTIATSYNFYHEIFYEDLEAQNLDDTDVWLVKYNNFEDADSTILDNLENIMTDVENRGYIYRAMEVLAEKGMSIHNTCSANDNSCDLGTISWAFKKESNGDYTFIGYYGLADALWDTFCGSNVDLINIDNIDFSQAYNLEKIEDKAFMGYDAESLSFPSSLKSIGEWAFYGFSGDDLQLSDSIEYIGEGAFQYYEGDNLILPNHLITVGDAAFYGYNGDNLVLPSSLRTIGALAFGGYVGEGNKLTIPEGVKYIGGEAFAKFAGTELSLANSITEIGGGAFLNYNTNIELVLPPNLEKIGYNAFFNYEGNGTSLVIPDNVTDIGEQAFTFFKGDSLTLGTGLTDLPYCVFCHYTGEELIIPSNIKTIGHSAFDGYKGETLIISNGVTEIGYGAFRSFNGSNLVLSNSLKSIGGEAFISYYGENTILNLPSGLERIGYYSFQHFSGNSIIVPSSIKSIGAFAFYSPNRTNIPPITIKMSEQDFNNVEVGDNWYYQNTLVYDPD